MVYICGPRHGRWWSIVPASSLRWVNDYGKPVKPPKRLRCEYPLHPTRLKRWWPLEQMWAQRWEMTREEFDQAIEAYDIFALEMGHRILCPHCAEVEERTALLGVPCEGPCG